MSDYYKLGCFTWPVSTDDTEAQRWFDRGLIWCFAFNHEEAIACFEKALAHDPGCAMARFGIAYAIGPNYNRPWIQFDPVAKEQALARAFDETQAAFSAGDRLSAMEKALVATLVLRYPARDPIEDQHPWDQAFSDALREVHQTFPDDLTIRALFAESLMNLTPWKMWDLASGEVAEGAGTVEAIGLLENAFAERPAAFDHPGLLHLYVHLMEMSPFPERALRAGDRLRRLVPDAGHLIHMPTHIDVLCGHYQDVVFWNQRAIEADRKFLEREGPMNYYSGYRVHNYHFTIYGAMFLGQFAPAIEAAEELIATTPEDLLRVTSPPMADYLEAYIAMKQHVLVRFGRWRTILDQPLPDDADLYCSTTALMHYARGLAHAVLGEIDDAEAARDTFQAARRRVPETRRVHNNIVPNLLAIGAAMLQGELDYRKADYDTAFRHLRQAVKLEDDLPYDEPWGWMQPARHALGALLLEQGELDEAESVYRADLGLDGQLRRACQHPDNPWSLHGLHECLQRKGDKGEITLIKQRLVLAAARADTPITASCFCRLDRAA